MLSTKTTLGLSCAAVGAIWIGLWGARDSRADELFQKPHVLFIQQDKVVTFDLTPPNMADQPLGGGQGANVGTATGAINGTTLVNFKFTFTSNPLLRPLTFNFDNRAGITDKDGDSIIFKNVGTGRFNAPLIDPTLIP